MMQQVEPHGTKITTLVSHYQDKGGFRLSYFDMEGNIITDESQKLSWHVGELAAQHREVSFHSKELNWTHDQMKYMEEELEKRQKRIQDLEAQVAILQSRLKKS